MKASIDQLTEKLLRQVKHYREKRSRRQVRGNGIPAAEVSTVTETTSRAPDRQDEAVRGEADDRRRRPCSSSSSSATTSSSSGTPSRARSTSSTGADGGYGLIEPQLTPDAAVLAAARAAARAARARGRAGLPRASGAPTRGRAGTTPGIHGVPRPREWDAVVTADAPSSEATSVSFVVLDDGTLVVEDGDGATTSTPLAEALERQLAAALPRRGASAAARRVWAVGARRIEVVELGRDVGRRRARARRPATASATLLVDGAPRFGTLPRARGARPRRAATSTSCAPSGSTATSGRSGSLPL